VKLQKHRTGLRDALDGLEGSLKSCKPYPEIVSGDLEICFPDLPSLYLCIIVDSCCVVPALRWIYIPWTTVSLVVAQSSCRAFRTFVINSSRVESMYCVRRKRPTPGDPGQGPVSTARA